MKKFQLLPLSLLAGLLLSLAWPMNGFPGLLFIAFVPLLWIEETISANRSRFHRFSAFTYTFPGFVVWCLLTTYWIWNSTPFGGVAAVLFNAFLMGLVFQVYHWIRKTIFTNHSVYVLIFVWISFEYLVHNWVLNWPWLAIGNGFASYPQWIQWYEYTGTFGGTFWVILVNILIYKLLKLVFAKERQFKAVLLRSVAVLLLIAVPLVISLIIYHNYTEKKHPVHIVVVQPNLDPYTQQYTVPPGEVIDMNLRLASQQMDSATQFVVSPESAIQEDIWERQLQFSPSLRQLKSFLDQNPHLTLIIGASTFKEYLPGEELSQTVRKFRKHEGYYDAYNTVFILDTADITKWYHKSKLTPGVEIMPFTQYFKFIEKLAIDLGGTVGSLGTDAERKVFETQYDSLKIAAVICYESAYGEWMAKFARNGANLFFVVTNDGWWGNTPGHRQHFTFSRIRAIESRRSIARSANTGISAFINQRGDVLEKTAYWEPAVIKNILNANWKKTFYVKFGDYIARISAFITVILCLIAVSLRLSRKRNTATDAQI